MININIPRKELMKIFSIYYQFLWGRLIGGILYLPMPLFLGDLIFYIFSPVDVERIIS